MLHFMNDEINNIQFPEVVLRHVGHVTRTTTVIDGYKAVVNQDTNDTYAIVKDGYKLLLHEDVLSAMDDIVATMPEYGKPTRTVKLSHNYGRLHVKYVFKEVDFKIGKLPNGEPDTINPTLEAFNSYDTTLIHKMIVGGFRVVCTNGLVVGKKIAEYKRKHTESLDIQDAKNAISIGMQEYNSTVDLWKNMLDRQASLPELKFINTGQFLKREKRVLVSKMNEVGTVKQLKPKDNIFDVDISSWQLYNVYTDVITHTVKDIVRTERINTKLKKVFV